jgi:hypothetical protein
MSLSGGISNGCQDPESMDGLQVSKGELTLASTLEGFIAMIL